MEKRLSLWEAFPIYGYEKGILISKEQGCPTIPLRLELPEIYTLTVADYEKLQELFFNIINILGPHRIIHRQDFFFSENYSPIGGRLNGDFLERANEFHFAERPILRGLHYLNISLAPKNYLKLSPKKANRYIHKTKEHFLFHSVPKDFLNDDLLSEFRSQVNSVLNLINSSELIKAELVSYKDLFSDNGLYSKYLTLSQDSSVPRDLSFKENSIWVGNKRAQYFSFENLDQFSKEFVTTYELFGKFSSVHNSYPIGNLFSIGFQIPYEHIINQYIYIPDQEKVLKQLSKKAKRFQQFASKKKDDSNKIYADEIFGFTKNILSNHKEMVYYHLNVLGFGDNHSNHKNLCNGISSAFKKLRLNIKQNHVDRKNLFFGGFPGNSIGIPSEMYMPMSSDMASSLLYFEGEYQDSSKVVDGMRLVDRASGRPLSVSVYREPEKRDWIFNRGMLVASGSGGGKSFFVNHYLASELRQGAEVVILEDGNSYDKITEVFGGEILQHDDLNPFTFNPFQLEKGDYVIGKNGHKALVESKLLFLVTLLKLILGESDRSNSKEVEKTVFELLIIRYYENMWKHKEIEFKFDTFLTYCEQSLDSIISTHKISREVFDPNVFLFLLKKYKSGNSRGYLLNRTDERITSIQDKKVVYFKLNKLIDNELLFPITALMIMQIFNKKMHDPEKLGINKILTVDEAWKALDRPELVHYFNGQSRMARKLGGQPIFISQKVDDFIASEIIKNAIIVNSHIKVFLDMRDFAKSFNTIQSIMGLTEKQKQLILSINKDLPEERKLREVAICWMDKVKVYGIETSLEEKCIYETNPTEGVQIQKLFESNNQNWELTAKAYAHNTKKLEK